MAYLIYLKLLLFALLPFLLAFACYFTWAIISCKSKDHSVLKTKAVSSLVILLFLVHPTLVSFFFKAFDCIDVDGDRRNKEDLDILCESQSHTYWSLLIALPGLIVWGLGIPFLALVLIFKARKRLETVETRA